MNTHPFVLPASSALVFAALALAGCGDHTAGVAPAVVESASAPTPTSTASPTPAAPRQTLAVDPATSSIGFTGAKITASHDGSFTDFSGTVELDPADVTRSAVRFEVRIASLQIEPAQLSTHLLSPDFFGPAEFPTATFESTAITAGATAQVAGATATHTVTGTLTLHGQSQRVSFPAIVTVTPTEVTARTEFTINRRDFGIVYPGLPDDLIRDQVVLRISLRAPRGA